MVRPRADGNDGDRPEVLVSADTAAMADAAADRAVEVLRGAVDGNGVAHAMFATGNSQIAFVDALARRAGDVPWGDVIVFHMDEYVGVGPDHPAGFQRWIRERITERLHPRAAHYLDGLAPPEDECARYAGLLAAQPLDLCCLGIGENGHLAFNDPPVADFDDPLDVKVVELDAACRAQQVNEGHFASDADVPTHAVTVTVPALLRAGQVLAIVPEARKAGPVQRALEGPVDPSCPASILQRTGHATVFLDPASAGLLAHRPGSAQR
jgi:glucosamine-6-phosphate deaminase